MAREAKRIDGVIVAVRAMDTRMKDLEQNTARVSDNGTDGAGDQNSGERRYVGNPLHDPDLTLTVSGIAVSDEEHPIGKARALIRELGEEVATEITVTAAVRLPAKLTDRPPILKFSVENFDQKVLVLRNKSKLRTVQSHEDVYIRSSKSRIERLIEMNARTVLRNLPQGCDFRVDGRGRIVNRQQQQPTTHQSAHERMDAANGH